MPEAPSGGFRHGSARPGITLADVGEPALLEQLVAIAAAARAPGGEFINGDDVAMWSPPPGRDLAISIDALVEDVDFRRSWITPRQLGRRAFAAAASDLAGSAADALCCVATLCVRGSELLEDVLEVQRGLCDAAAAVGCAMVGGDVSATEGPAVIDVCVTGSVPAGGGLRRASGVVGDAVLVTGVLGRAAAGLRLLMAGERGTSPAEQGWVDAQLEPSARLREGAELAERGARCGGDISDGLVPDAGRTALASGCAVELWRDHLPVDDDLGERFGSDWLELAVARGEDFELLVTVPEAKLDGVLRSWPSQLAPLTRVGSLVVGAGVHMLDRRGGATVPLPAGRAGHFA